MAMRLRAASALLNRRGRGSLSDAFKPPPTGRAAGQPAAPAEAVAPPVEQLAVEASGCKLDGPRGAPGLAVAHGP